jgi:hypothetical protein
VLVGGGGVIHRGGIVCACLVPQMMTIPKAKYDFSVNLAPLLGLRFGVAGEGGMLVDDEYKNRRAICV